MSAALRIVLINVGRREQTPALTPPLGLLYLAAYVRRHLDVDITILDQREADWPDPDLVSRVAELEPDIVGMRCLTGAHRGLRVLTQGIRQALPKTLLALGGPHVSAFGAVILDHTAADMLVAGEGERSFLHIVQTFLDNRDYSGIPGLIWRSPDSGIVSNPGHGPIVENLDDLPFPAYDLIDIRRYWANSTQVFFPMLRKYIAMFSSRGCPWHCSYCHNIFGKKFRFHSAERVVDEIAHYVKTFGVEDVDFMDDSFNFAPERVAAIADLLGKRGVKVNVAFPNGMRTDILTQETVDALADMGAWYSSFALESASERIQKQIEKHLNIPRFIQGVEMAVRRGILATGFTMIGFPGETLEEMQLTVDTVCASKLHSAFFFYVTPFPGTELYRQTLRDMPERLRNMNYDDSFSYFTFDAVSNLSTVPDPVFFRFADRAYRKFYLNLRRIARIVRDTRSRRTLPMHLLYIGDYCTRDLAVRRWLGKRIPIESGLLGKRRR
ncbi:MAG TPA: radical SAM protein [Candidatus Hydrogenedentes bacterium]|nr:radical SAM protein [Candidatus Hydrogenedentota bacterium]